MTRKSTVRCHPNDATSLCRQLGGYIEQVSRWMSANRLQLNAANTEFLRLVPPRRRRQLPPDHLVVGPVQVAPVASARDLGVYLDIQDSRLFNEDMRQTHMTRKTHVTRLVSSLAMAFFDRFAASVDRYSAHR